MPDATKQIDTMPDVTSGNQDVPGQMNQPPHNRGMNVIGAETGTTIQSSEPQVVDPFYEDLPKYLAGQAPDDQVAPSRYPGDSPVPLDTAELTPAATGHLQFDTDNGYAIGVFQRAAHDWTSGSRQPTSAQGPEMVVGRMKGRTSTTVWVPSKDANGNVPLGVVIGSTEGECQQGGFDVVVLNVSDSITINSEAPVWVGVISGNSTGFCQFKSEYNPPGGELGGM